MRINVSLTEENSQRFKALGASRWLNRILASEGSIYVLTESERMSLIEVVSGSSLHTEQKEKLIRKLVGSSER